MIERRIPWRQQVYKNSKAEIKVFESTEMNWTTRIDRLIIWFLLISSINNALWPIDEYARYDFYYQELNEEVHVKEGMKDEVNEILFDIGRLPRLLEWYEYYKHQLDYKDDLLKRMEIRITTISNKMK